MFCVKCGKQIEDNIKFCPFCGEKNIPQQVAEPAAEEVKAEPVKVGEPLPEVKQKKAKKPKVKKLFALIAVILVLAIGLGVGVPMYINSTKSDAFVLYMKDEGLYIAYNDTHKVQRLAKYKFETIFGVDYEEYKENNEVYSLLAYDDLKYGLIETKTAYNKESGYLYFPADVTDPALGKFMLKRIKVDSVNNDKNKHEDVTEDFIYDYWVSEDNSRIYYINTNKELRCINNGADERIANGVNRKIIDIEKGQYYYSTGNGFYSFNPETLEVSRLAEFAKSETLQEMITYGDYIYLQTEENLFCIDSAGNCNKLVSDDGAKEVDILYRNNDEETLYISVAGGDKEVILLEELIDDDCADSDSELIEKVEIVDGEYKFGTDEVYAAKKQRDKLRDFLSLEEYGLKARFDKLYVVKNGEAELLSDSLFSFEGFSFRSNENYCFTEFDKESFEKIKMSDLFDTIIKDRGEVTDITRHYASDVIWEKIKDHYRFYAFEDNRIFEVEEMRNYDEAEGEDGDHAEEKEETTVSSNDLYINEKLIDVDVHHSVEFGENTIYWKNYSATDKTGDCYLYNGTESVLVKKEIKSAIVDENNTVFYISKDNDLIMLDGDKEIKLDSDVTSVFDVN